MDDKEIQLDNYVTSHTSAEPVILKDLVRQTNLRLIHPRMLSGHVQGRMLKMFVHMIKPKRILELGTFTGYSALCLAEGLEENSCIDTIEVDEELQDFLESFFEKSEFKQRINLFVGDSLDIIPKLEYKYDLVFIDANKRNYIDYYNLVFDKVEKGGYIIADNVLWDGHVLKNNAQIKHNDFQTRGIKDFNDFVHNDDRVENVLLPVRDGLMIIRKK